MVFRRLAKRRRVVRRKQAAGPKALKMVRKLTRTLRPETKIFDLTATANPTTAGTTYDLCFPAQGDNYLQREGIVIQPKWVDVRFTLAMNASAVDTFVRVIFYRGIRDEGITWSLGDVLVAANIISPYVWLTRDKFTIISDTTYNLNDAQRMSVAVRKRFSVSSRPIKFTGAGTGIQDGGIQMLIFTNEVSNTPAFSFYSRVAFTDV